jgi:predicted PhzF superfamily epimerase YddE/YHI9
MVNFCGHPAIAAAHHPVFRCVNMDAAVHIDVAASSPHDATNGEK